MTIPLMPVDFVILAVMILSGFFAAYRGFVNEFLSVLGWGMTAIVTAVLFGSIRGTVRDAIDPDWIADIVGFVGLFLIVVIPTSFVCYRIGEAVRQSSIGPLDRSLGFVFGIVRGLAIAAVGYLIFAWLVPSDRQPNWIKEAKLLPIVQRSGDVVNSLINGRQVKGVSVSAATPPQQRPEPRRYAPPEQVVSVEPPARIDARPNHPTVYAVPPPASEVQSLAIPPEPEPAPKSVPTQRKPTSKATKVVEKAKSKAKTDKLAKAKPSATKRAPKTQLASANKPTSGKPGGDKAGGKGYGTKERQDLDQLIRSTNREP